MCVFCCCCFVTCWSLALSYDVQLTNSEAILWVSPAMPFNFKRRLRMGEIQQQQMSSSWKTTMAKQWVAQLINFLTERQRRRKTLHWKRWATLSSTNVESTNTRITHISFLVRYGFRCCRLKSVCFFATSNVP